MTRYFVGLDYYPKSNSRFLGIKTDKALINEYYTQYVEDTEAFYDLVGDSCYETTSTEDFLNYCMQAMHLTEIPSDLVEHFIDQVKTLTYVQFGIGAKPQ